mgnify:FL=1
MFILTRHRDGSITISDGVDTIEISVVDIRGDKVRLSITAPQETPVHCGEDFHARPEVK